MPEYTGHHGQHIGLQNHSVGDIYPLAVVAYDNGEKLCYTLENLTHGTVACHNSGGLRVWDFTVLVQRYALWHSRGINSGDPFVSSTSPPVWVAGRPSFVDGELCLQRDAPLAVPCVPLTPYQEYQRALELDNV